MNKTKTKTKTMTITALILFCTSAMAGQRDFTKLDTDGNNKLSLSEFLVKVNPDRIAKMTKIFGNKDKNDDGYLTKAEFKYQGGI